MKITNNSPASQGIQTVSGLVYVRPGKTKEAELTAEQADRAGRIGGIALEGDPVPDVAEPAKMELDANDDTTEEAAQLRAQFNASWDAACAKAGAAEGESLTGAIERLVENAASAASFEASLRTALDLKEGEGILEGITALKDRIAELELENEEIKKQIPAPAKLEAVHRGRGSYSILGADGKEIVEGLDKTTADQFNAMDDAAKAAFIEANKKAA